MKAQQWQATEVQQHTVAHTVIVPLGIIRLQYGVIIDHNEHESLEKLLSCSEISLQDSRKMCNAISKYFH